MEFQEAQLSWGKREAGTESDLIIKTIIWRQSLHCPGSVHTHTATKSETESARTVRQVELWQLMKHVKKKSLKRGRSVIRFLSER